MKHDEKNGKQSCGERGGGGVEKEEEAEQSDRPRKREGRITEREWVGENGMVGCNDVENREDWSS